jgi:hypothetical protein
MLNETSNKNQEQVNNWTRKKRRRKYKHLHMKGDVNDVKSQIKMM